MIALALSRFAELTLPALPAALDAPLGHIAGTLAYAAAPRARAAVRSNLRVVTGRTDLTRRVFVWQVRHYLETFRILRLTRERLLAMVDLEGWPEFTRAHARGKGVIMASAHLGPVIVCGQVLAARGLDVAVLVETKSGAMAGVIDRARSALGIRTYDIRSVRGIARTLMRGGAVGFIADRAVTGVGERVPFFGRPALLPSGHIALALRTGAAVVPAFASRHGGRLVARVEPELEIPRTGDRDADIREGVRMWAEVLERHVARTPDEWSVFEAVWER